ncbi:MAG: competence/damage-inducible protein A, partial [Streptococcaceae bacterium]|nr:competence/damage-inducible protein A [Streptococcaceae bacterium]
MKAEVIAVGTELLMGQVVNSNATEISRALNEIGVDVFYHTTVGDNAERMKEAIALAESRSDCIILTGGLGPTDDDITKQVLAEHLGERLVRDPKGYARLLDYFAVTKREHTPNNDLQVLTLENGEVLDNDNGNAVGTVIEKNGKIFAILPGPPREMKLMLRRYLLPILEGRNGESGRLYSKVLRFYGIGESQLTTQLSEWIENQTDPTLAPYAKTAEVTLRLSTKTKDPVEAERKLEQLADELLATGDVGAYFYGIGDENSLPKVAFDALLANGLTVTAAESLTGGKFQSMIADFEGASKVFKGGFVTYSLEEKVKMLGLDAAELEKNGVVSAYCAREMAIAARKK